MQPEPLLEALAQRHGQTASEALEQQHAQTSSASGDAGMQHAQRHGQTASASGSASMQHAQRHGQTASVSGNASVQHALGHGQTSSVSGDASMQDAETDASWTLLAAYAVKVCSADQFEHVPLLGSDPCLVASQPSCQPQSPNAMAVPCNHVPTPSQIFASQAQERDQQLPEQDFVTQVQQPCQAQQSQEHDLLERSFDFVSQLQQSCYDNPSQGALLDDSLPSSFTFPHEMPSLSQLLGCPSGPSARRGFDHAVLPSLDSGPWQVRTLQSRTDDAVVWEALSSPVDNLFH